MRPLEIGLAGVRRRVGMGETFVLLHGSWHGGWAWEPTAWCLRERGHSAYAPTYPGHRPDASRRGIKHEDYVDAVTAFIETLDLRDIVLVGHSFGGSVISRTSQRIPDRIKRLVFHTAFVVEDGTSVNDNIAADQTEIFERSAEASPDNTVTCPWEVFRDSFIQDASPEEARSVWDRLVPQPFQPWDAKLDLKAFYASDIPRSYIAVRDDLALPEGNWHPKMSSRLGTFKLVEMGGSHEVMFTRPSALADKLAEAAND
jgi:pimeloyl-ACP methyl ester carboxylesterase